MADLPPPDPGRIVVDVAPWYRLSTDAMPTVSGTWVCQDRTPLHLTLTWLETSLVDAADCLRQLSVGAEVAFGDY